MVISSMKINLVVRTVEIKELLAKMYHSQKRINNQWKIDKNTKRMTCYHFTLICYEVSVAQLL